VDNIVDLTDPLAGSPSHKPKKKKGKPGKIKAVEDDNLLAEVYGNSKKGSKQKEPKSKEKPKSKSKPEKKVRLVTKITATGATKGTTNKPLTPKQLDKALEKALLGMNYEIEAPSQEIDPKNCIHTGLFMLDLILCGGYRKGRMYTHTGLPNSGKSTLIQEGIAAAQKELCRIFFADIEESATRQYMTRQGIIADHTYRLADGGRGFYYLEPETGEHYYRMACRVLNMMPRDHDVNTPPKTVIFTDSYESMLSEKITEETNPIGAHAQMHSRFQKMLRKKLKRAGAVHVATNQLRTAGIGSFFVNPEAEAGGYALKYYSDAKTVVRMGRPGTKGCPEGIAPVTIECTRNRMADPFHKARFRLIIGKGFDRLFDRLEFLVTVGEIKRDGTNYVIAGKKLNYKKAREAMKDPHYLEVCRSLRRKTSTYKQFFNSLQGEEDDLEN
jgi:recombination protein RecA